MDGQWHPACAGPNFALIKYWGKQPGTANVPAVESLALTVQGLQTRIALRLGQVDADRLCIDERPVQGPRLTRLRAFLDLFRARAGRSLFAEVHSRTDFPLAAGLASSASSFAALTLAADSAFGLHLPLQDLADLARQGSGSAPRSLLGGLTHLRVCPDGPHPTALEGLDAAGRMPLSVVVAILSRQDKAVGSSAGMERSRLSSPLYGAWVAAQAADIRAARAAIAAGDFAALAEVAEHSCLKMHAVTQSSRPPLLYATPATWEGMQRVRALRAAGVPVFFTVDAGPQLKAVCHPAAAAQVQASLAALPEVAEVRLAPAGPAAQRLPACARLPWAAG